MISAIRREFFFKKGTDTILSGDGIQLVSVTHDFKIAGASLVITKV